MAASHGGPSATAAAFSTKGNQDDQPQYDDGYRRDWPCDGRFSSGRPCTDTRRRNKAIVQRSFDAWAAGTGSPYDLLAEDAVWTIAGNSLASKVYPSRAAFIGEVIQPFVARMSVGLKPVIREIYADGNTVIVHFDAAGTAKDGKPYENTYAWFLGLADGKIVKATAFYDSIAFNDLLTRVQPNQ